MKQSLISTVHQILEDCTNGAPTVESIGNGTSPTRPSRFKPQPTISLEPDALMWAADDDENATLQFHQQDSVLAEPMKPNDDSMHQENCDHGTVAMSTPTQSVSGTLPDSASSAKAEPTFSSAPEVLMWTQNEIEDDTAEHDREERVVDACTNSNEESMQQQGSAGYDSSGIWTATETVTETLANGVSRAKSEPTFSLEPDVLMWTDNEAEHDAT